MVFLCTITVLLFLLPRPHPVNAAVQYEPRVMTEEEAAREWASVELREFMERVTPRCIHQCNFFS